MRYFNLIRNGINKILDKTIGVFEMAVLGIVVISTLSYALAWQAPSQTPPAGNVDAPLNTGSTGQAKSGGLILNTGGAATGLVVQNGSVGIGTTIPSSKLDVNGEISADALRVHSGTDANLVLARSNVRTWILGVIDGPNLVVRDQTSGANMAIFEAGAPGNSLFIKSNGLVGIGTAYPSYKLDVNGDIQGSTGRFNAVAVGRSISVGNDISVANTIISTGGDISAESNSWGSCNWNSVGSDKTHHWDTSDWCSNGAYITQLDFDSCDGGNDCPIVGRVKCCKP